jgi:hypothetical protein
MWLTRARLCKDRREEPARRSEKPTAVWVETFLAGVRLGQCRFASFFEDYTQRRRQPETRLLLLSELLNEKPYLGPELPAHLYEIRLTKSWQSERNRSRPAQGLSPEVAFPRRLDCSGRWGVARPEPRMFRVAQCQKLPRQTQKRGAGNELQRPCDNSYGYALWDRAPRSVSP